MTDIITTPGKGCKELNRLVLPRVTVFCSFSATVTMAHLLMKEGRHVLYIPRDGVLHSLLTLVTQTLENMLVQREEQTYRGAVSVGYAVGFEGGGLCGESMMCVIMKDW